MHANIPESQQLDSDVERVVTGFGGGPRQLLPILQSLNQAHIALDAPVLDDVARSMGIPSHQAEGVAGFYSLLDRQQPVPTIRVCDGVACWLKGSGRFRETIDTRLADQSGNSEWRVIRSSCLGLCDRAPAALVQDRQTGPLNQTNISCLPHVPKTKVDSLPAARLDEHRVLLAHHGKIDPKSIEDALNAGVYAGLKRAFTMSRSDVIREVERSGLRGRGGAGFPTGRKWKTVADSPGVSRYVVCNADESEPLMFKDRVFIDGNPHAVIEGIAVAAFAVDAREAIVYIRGEYEPQARLLEHAIEQADERGLLRHDPAKFSLTIHVHRGAGAYICGEETALLESLEGRRGEPRLRPPYPAQVGYLNEPTVVNNVETLAAIGRILALGWRSYRQTGPTDEPGTRLFTLLGHVVSPGLVEMTFRRTLREMLAMAGGMENGSNFKFALVGGAAGAVVGLDALDVPFDYSSETQGVPMGAGGVLFCDDSVSAAQLVRELMFFFEQESCGKCTPCRVGISLVRQTLDRMIDGDGTPADIDRLHRIARQLQETSFCGLGTGAALPIATALQAFPQDFESLV
jgi:NADH:ubiquinone oxidoreductase subunit F (NADH-binding)/NADH:ubiquinone oxidoreductase subunit E